MITRVNDFFDMLSIGRNCIHLETLPMDLNKTFVKLREIIEVSKTKKAQITMLNKCDQYRGFQGDFGRML